ncbi:uncharacterized protein F5891DRAFT_601140 [Suillus fuscotomentosus]|uniref:Uncharacterized protein n=1 Tax=Suillus fuscotomentosus TaxID=1912939 RepID=A0AAD4HET3_9AGAM|nr:uncharacterized protein F5891DRAFT_697776 [Suillus fuscotomentosus]XP_041221954.1 uncharacterized protein F5891DRAFT_601140 [Suillus fuscotomentosus]KAG1894975.1 hypothetical protein F5891DRAFT_697776 [Suillus fuscotomentosus]KAG1896378.1 hypothetical protein F5891DRAFT_601140 [Suillus fuscotomentosus]
MCGNAPTQPGLLPHGDESVFERPRRFPSKDILQALSTLGPHQIIPSLISCTIQHGCPLMQRQSREKMQRIVSSEYLLARSWYPTLLHYSSRIRTLPIHHIAWMLASILLSLKMASGPYRLPLRQRAYPPRVFLLQAARKHSKLEETTSRPHHIRAQTSRGVCFAGSPSALRLASYEETFRSNIAPVNRPLLLMKATRLG